MGNLSFALKWTQLIHPSLILLIQLICVYAGSRGDITCSYGYICVCMYMLMCAYLCVEAIMT